MEPPTKKVKFVNYFDEEGDRLIADIPVETYMLEDGNDDFFKDLQLEEPIQHEDDPTISAVRDEALLVEDDIPTNVNLEAEIQNRTSKRFVTAFMMHRTNILF